MDLINLRLMSHPVNWLIVWVTLALACLGAHLIVKGLQDPASSSIAPD